MGFRTFVAMLIATASLIQSVFPRVFGQLEPRNEIIETIRWQGPVIRGRADFVFTVLDVDDLEKQIKNKNPKFSSVSGGPHEAEMDRGLRVCDGEAQIATGRSDSIANKLTFIRALGGNWYLPPNTCHRIGCGSEGGVYWCSDAQTEVKASAKDIYFVGMGIMSNCCHYSETYGDLMVGTEAFHSNHPANNTRIALGYANCNYSAIIPPHTFPYPGHNGQCPRAW